MSVLPEAWKFREALQRTLCLHRISCFNVLGHLRNSTPQLPYIRRASPPTQEQQRPEEPSANSWSPLELKGSGSSLQYPKANRDVSLNQPLLQIYQQAVIHLFYQNLYYIQRWKEGIPRVKLQLNYKFILCTLPSGLLYLWGPRQKMWLSPKYWENEFQNISFSSLA